MAVYDKNGLIQRMLQLIRSAGINGKTTAQNVRDFTQDLIDTMFSLFGQNTGSEDQDLEWDSQVSYNLTTNQFCISRLRIFKSKVDNNQGHEPPYIPNDQGAYEDDYWIEVSPAPKAGVPAWKAGTYLANDAGDPIIVFYSAGLYYLDVALPFESTDIVGEIGEGKWKGLGGAGGDRTLTITDANRTDSVQLAQGERVIHIILDAALTSDFVPADFTGWEFGGTYTLIIDKLSDNLIDLDHVASIHYADRVDPFVMLNSMNVGQRMIVQGFGIASGKVIFAGAIFDENYSA